MGIAVILGSLIGWEARGSPKTSRRTGNPYAHSPRRRADLEVSGTSAGAIRPHRRQIVTSVGFLGAGTIMRLDPVKKPMTSAASIWATAGIGMAVSTEAPSFGS
ncbi:MAG: MgtC/SapB family protein [Fimbriimonadales bacterium]